MATFTTISKVPLDWQAPPPEKVTGVAYQLDIGSGFLLDIGDGFNLTIQPEIAQIQWTRTGKTVQHEWPAQVTPDEFYLSIGGGFDLLIGDGYKLSIGPSRPSTVWSGIDKNEIPRY